MENSRAIALGQGVGALRFGLTRDQTRHLLGEPEEVEKAEDNDDYEHEAWNYLDLGYSLYFDQEDGYRLSCIETDRADLTLYGEPLVGRPYSEVRALMARNGHADATVEEMEAGERQLSYEQEMIDLYFVDDVLVVINFGVYVDDANFEVKWPAPDTASAATTAEAEAADTEL